MFETEAMGLLIYICDVENKHGYQGERQGRDKWETEIGIYALRYIEQITNKDLLCSTGNSSQYSVMTYMRKKVF